MTSADAPEPNDGVPGRTPRSIDAFEDLPEDTDLTDHADTAMIDEFAQDAEGDPDIVADDPADDEDRRAQTAEGALSPGSTATGAPTSTDDDGALRENPLGG
ncbi:hypothetical protein SAMN04489806_1576 [Paramicrobacterium humi]|uniref:Uncharacterized protein n=1 Tax=Paramicrobacterium humi TaxID=640635 RepID=A0A1H4LK86_9MICO|nr:hypothetical protein [Microbacterium humi]SEB71199.1 hypothetical protein SAMN04489806_1576 [Microbacterium humi]